MEALPLLHLMSLHFCCLLVSLSLFLSAALLLASVLMMHVLSLSLCSVFQSLLRVVLFTVLPPSSFSLLHSCLSHCLSQSVCLSVSYCDCLFFNRQTGGTLCLSACVCVYMYT